MLTEMLIFVAKNHIVHPLQKQYKKLRRKMVGLLEERVGFKLKSFAILTDK